MKTSKQIIKYLKEKGQTTGKELTDFLGLGDRTIRKQLSGLLNSGIIAKVGK